MEPEDKVEDGDRFMGRIHTGCFCDGTKEPNTMRFGIADDCNCDVTKGKIYGCTDWTQNGDGSVCSNYGSKTKIGGTRLTITSNVLTAIYGRIVDVLVGLSVCRFAIYRKSVTPELAEEEGLFPNVCGCCNNCLSSKIQKMLIIAWMAVATPIILFFGTFGLMGSNGGSLRTMLVAQFVFEWIVAEPAETVITCLLGLHDEKQLMGKGDDGEAEASTEVVNPVKPQSDEESGGGKEEGGKKTKKSKSGKKK
jgi:hypothetical protein